MDTRDMKNRGGGSMAKRRDYQRKNGGQGGYNYQGQRNSPDQGAPKDAPQGKNYGRDNSRQPHAGHPSQGRYNNRVKAEETVEDIKADIHRIEKEIQLEIKEIKSLKL